MKHVARNALDFPSIIPAPTHHAFISGMNGCGKTILAEVLLGTRRNNLILVFDPKDELNWYGFKKYNSIYKLITANPRHAIYAPRIEELDDPAVHDAFFKFGFIRQRKNFKHRQDLSTTVYVDEVYSVTRNQELPLYYKADLTRGRKIRLETWSATQRPKLIPQFLMSESKHNYLFYHQMLQDKQKLEQTFGVPMDLLDSISFENHEFVYTSLNKISERLTLKLKGHK